MQTQDILENQPWTLIEDEMLGAEIPNDSTEDDSTPTDVPKPKPITSPVQPTKTSDNPFRLLAEDIGIELDDNWDGDADEFKQHLTESIRQEVLSNMNLDNPVVDGFIKYVSNGGNPYEFIEAMNNSSVDRMTPEQVYISYMKSTTSLSDDRIKKMMYRSKDSGEFEDDVESFKEEMKSAQDAQIQSIIEQQEQAKLERLELAKQAGIERKRLAKQKTLLGVPVSKNTEFERFYLNPSERINYEGKTYTVTPYQKRLMERQKNPLEYEALLAYLEFVNYKLPSDGTQIRTEMTKDLKSKLNAYYSDGTKTTRLIDES